MVQRPKLTRGQRALLVIVVFGVVTIAAIGFIGSYTAVRHLALREGFGWFSYALPVGVDAGIIVFLALDLILTWLRIPLPPLRYLAWTLTAATIIFNAASAWPRPLATGMHAIVPVLFIAAIEGARHAVGRITAIDADTYMEGTRLGRWFLAPIATFRLWRRRLLWEVSSYKEALEHERRRLVYRARLKAAYGRRWRHRAPVDQLLLLKLANLGEPLPEFRLDLTSVDRSSGHALPQGLTRPAVKAASAAPEMAMLPGPRQSPDPQTADTPSPAEAAAIVPCAEPAAPVPVPQADFTQEPSDPGLVPERAPRPDPVQRRAPGAGTAEDRYYQAFAAYRKQHGAFPDGDQLGQWLWHESGVKGRSGEALTAGHLRRYLPKFRQRWQEAPEPAEDRARAGVPG